MENKKGFKRKTANERNQQVRGPIPQAMVIVTADKNIEKMRV